MNFLCIICHQRAFILYCSLPSDIGNRITSLTKTVTRMHSDMKVLHQVLMDDGRAASDALTRDGSSFLGKYIVGAKNNFVGFNSKLDEKNTSLEVTVHHGGGGVETEGSKDETDRDVMEMEEGRAKIEPGEEKESENKKQVEADKTEVKEVVVAGKSFNHSEEKQKEEDEAEGRRAGEILPKHTEKTSQKAQGNKVNNEETDIKKVANKVKDVELREQKMGSEWRNDGAFEPDGPKKSGVSQSNATPAAKKTIPSPTGSSSSHDTGFSDDGAIVTP